MACVPVLWPERVTASRVMLVVKGSTSGGSSWQQLQQRAAGQAGWTVLPGHPPPPPPPPPPAPSLLRRSSSCCRRRLAQLGASALALHSSAVDFGYSARISKMLDPAGPGALLAPALRSLELNCQAEFGFLERDDSPLFKLPQVRKGAGARQGWTRAACASAWLRCGCAAAPPPSAAALPWRPAARPPATCNLQFAHCHVQTAAADPPRPPSRLQLRRAANRHGGGRRVGGTAGGGMPAAACEPRICSGRQQLAAQRAGNRGGCAASEGEHAASGLAVRARTAVAFSRSVGTHAPPAALLPAADSAPRRWFPPVQPAQRLWGTSQP